MKKPSLLTQALAYSGLIPFLFITSTALLCLPLTETKHQLIITLLTTKILSSYTLIIIVFMAGSHWGQHLNAPITIQKTLSITSISITLITWAAYLLLSTKPFIPLTIICFILLLFIDKMLQRNQLINDDYFTLRLIITSIVICCLTITYFRL